ncbi:hypothetical protein ACFWWM_20905 [Streptomyces sp. NPDC058682]|uniref:hypothetical protein n=1 Tax=Streptomyces sp. NPDC058682 TaxID=3346596 RepID=UPI00366163D7
MSLTVVRWGLSSWAKKPWAITVIVIVLITWAPAGEGARALVEALTLVTALLAYEVQQLGTATTSTAAARCPSSGAL